MTMRVLFFILIGVSAGVGVWSVVCFLRRRVANRIERRTEPHELVSGAAHARANGRGVSLFTAAGRIGSACNSNNLHAASPINLRRRGRKRAGGCQTVGEDGMSVTWDWLRGTCTVR